MFAAKHHRSVAWFSAICLLILQPQLTWLTFFEYLLSSHTVYNGIFPIAPCRTLLCSDLEERRKQELKESGKGSYFEHKASRQM